MNLNDSVLFRETVPWWARLVKSEMKLAEHNGWMQEALNKCVWVCPALEAPGARVERN